MTLYIQQIDRAQSYEIFRISETFHKMFIHTLFQFFKNINCFPFYRFHPYLFFNSDGITITFMGFCVNDKGDAVDPNNGNMILPKVMSNDLKRWLLTQGVDLSDNYSKW